MGQFVSIVNPLPLALAHYEEMLVQTLRSSGHNVERLATIPGESSSGVRKLFRAARMVAERLAFRHDPNRVTLVLWPIFGLGEGILWRLAARRARIVLIIHDPRSLRTAARSEWIGKRLARHSGGRVEYVTHSTLAAMHLQTDTLLESTVRRHPIAVENLSSVSADRTLVFRVLGQYKEARNLDWLHEVARVAPPEVRLEIVGRGWPEVSGWSVRSEFVSEAEFDQLVGTATAVLIPYSRVYQSGVVIRCLEALTPVIAPANEQMTDIFSSGWLGVVQESEGSAAISAAVTRLLSEDTILLRGQMIKYREDYRRRTATDWRSL
jgi:glycosyltransferase involved in cell wall biosynthesis